ncbi:hypothetical protein D3C80_446700 [compost metagenome]
MLDRAHAGREGKATDTAGHADQAGHHADFPAKTLGHQLEYRAIACAQTEHGADEKCQCGVGTRQIEADHGNADCRDGVHRQQSPNAAEPVSQRATQGAHQAAAEHAGCGVVAGGHRAQAVLVVEITGQGTGQTDEAAECHAVEKHEPPAVTIAQGLEVVGHGFGFWPLGGIAGQPGEDDQGQNQRNQGETEHVAPANRRRQHRGDQCGEHRARVPRAGDAHGLALMLRRIPLRGQGQGDGERSAGHAEEQAQQQRLLVAVDPEFPGAEERADHDDLTDQAGGFGRQAISQHPHDKTQDRPGQNRRGHHQPPLLRRQVQVGGDLYRQRTEQVPDHEAQVEIEESCEQCGCMAGFPEA